MSYDFDLFVIGGGSGGVRCARIAASHGARVGVAEERFWGGTCVNVGCVPKKLLVMASEYGAALQDARGFGWDVPPARHDWAALIAAKDHEITRLNGIYRRLLEGAGCTIFDARATFLDAHTLDVGGRRVTAGRIVVATGGAPVRPDFPGAAHTIVSDDAFYLKALPRRIVILGGGYIAVEFAGLFAGLGATVDLVYRQPLPLRGFDEDLRTALAEAMETGGIRLHPGTTIASVTAAGEAKRVVLADGTDIEADLVFVATGRLPNTKGLGLDRAGVATDGFGAVLVEGQAQTSVPHIFAIGDVTNRLNLTPVAIAEGHALAERLFGPGPREWVLDAVATAVFSSPPIGTVGMTEEQAALQGPADIYVTRFTPMRHTLSGRPRRTLMKLVVCQQTQRVLGAHMLGEDAPEIIQGLSIAINTGATKQDFDRTVGVHPTAAEEFVTLRTRTRVALAPTVEEVDATGTPAEEMGAAEMGVGGGA
ncbi:Glutathione reductase [Rhodovastum atsumiense]|uniref:Glutathione-disulfide reductase n=1 Tax=Rhodovastum atsumiense TaxID=504468 RepID=A0A5M6ING1_9PROT|nr:glutathione-disulfide reductase [Rhodovastum atsumiense]KAA5609796.1 glutathione-disulfide reductase [Rhodovastum atsumiense]CAH2599419.1 Glutathione reductase [Rhodovastum atsumiense]